MRALVAAAAWLAGLAFLGLVAAPAAPAAGPKRPAVVSLAAAPRQVPAEGGPVRLTVRVRNAAVCSFRRESAPIGAVSCRTGSASRVVRIAANPLRRPVVLRFSVLVSGRGGKVSRAVAVVQAAAPAPLAVVTTSPLPAGTAGTPYSGALQGAGGTPPYAWTLASGSLPAGLTLAADGAIAGTPAGSGGSSFTAQVRDAAGGTASQQFSLVVRAPLLGVGALTTSTNWSGYALDGSGFTSVTGTFTVPTVGQADPSTSTAEWVGIDGFSGDDLIQAGVAEDVTFGRVSVYAWWEILPVPVTQIDTSLVGVQPGDTVTVSIGQAAPGSWTIQVTDATRSQSFTTTQAYAGGGQSAEWIVEAATDARSNRVLTLGAYSPPVAFTGIGWTGIPSGTWTPVQLQQRGGGVVSVPSAFDAGQTAFAVAYGSAAPPAPG